ncbi:hypothetical protein [Phytoactinopolyspora halophila]|uniref:hypothetical protein n=1 Tax=Phytoactinopolyspora halophila TaxID=1981511 RepID=UPI00131463F3|nr:hypothetical protein [Phytoactinopolyspora halophila]
MTERDSTTRHDPVATADHSTITKKNQDLDDPDTVGLYSLLRRALDWLADDPWGRRGR